MNLKDFKKVKLFSERHFPNQFDLYTYDTINKKAVNQLFYAILDNLSSALTRKVGSGTSAYFSREHYFTLVLSKIRRDYGVIDLNQLPGIPQNINVNTTSYDDRRKIDETKCWSVFLNTKNHLLILNMIEMLFMVNSEKVQGVNSTEKSMREEINNAFLKNGLGYEMIGAQINVKTSEVIHDNAMRPAYILLQDHQFEGAQEEFLKAHQLFRENNFKDAIVNANKAFESTLKIIIKLSGWNVDPKQLNSASGLIKCYMDNSDLIPAESNQLHGLKSMLQSLPSLRNINGHGQGLDLVTAERFHCEYALNSAATSILYLVKRFNANKK